MTKHVPRAKYPWWVKLSLWGVPGRVGLWALVVLSVVTAGWCVARGFTDSRFFIGAVFLYSALVYWRSIRWVDRHGSWKADAEPPVATPLGDGKRVSNSVTPTSAPVRLLKLFGAAVTGVFASACLGAITNAINGWISPLYFVTILRWQGVENVWRASIVQGLFEGLCFGMFFSLVFTTGVAIITRASCGYWFAVRHLLGIMAGAFLCWLLGGALGMGLASFSPEFYRRTFIGVPPEYVPRLAYAWVIGSNMGLRLGGLVSVVLGLIALRGNWRRTRRPVAPPPPPPADE